MEKKLYLGVHLAFSSKFWIMDERTAFTIWGQISSGDVFQAFNNCLCGFELDEKYV